MPLFPYKMEVIIFVLCVSISSVLFLVIYVRNRSSLLVRLFQTR